MSISYHAIFRVPCGNFLSSLGIYTGSRDISSSSDCLSRRILFQLVSTSLPGNFFHIFQFQILTCTFTIQNYLVFANRWCSLFNADLALSVAVTSISSILSVALLPANLFLYGWLAYNVILGKPNVNIVSSLDFSAIFISLAVVLGAIISGLSAGYLYDNYTFHRRANRFGSICGLLLIIFSGFLGSGGGGGNASVWHMEWSFYAGTALPCLIGIGLANFASRMLNVFQTRNSNNCN